MVKALVIGYGSIGKRHANILQSMSKIKEVTVLSQQTNVPFNTHQSLEQSIAYDPDYIVIANCTTRHYQTLQFIEERFTNKLVLIEKPLFDQSYDFIPENNHVWVAYNLRFHPLIQLIKEKILDRNLWTFQATCCSYLPEWRSGVDYRKSSSALISSGGGVLLDLSHELDYIRWFLGGYSIDYVYSDKVSNLEIKTDDCLLLQGRSLADVRLQLSLNYFSRTPLRQIIVDGEGISIQANLISSKAVVVEDGVEKQFDWPHLDRNYTYSLQHKAVLSNDAEHLCSYTEGQKLMELIDRIRHWRKE